MPQFGRRVIARLATTLPLHAPVLRRCCGHGQVPGRGVAADAQNSKSFLGLSKKTGLLCRLQASQKKAVWACLGFKLAQPSRSRPGVHFARHWPRVGRVFVQEKQRFLGSSQLRLPCRRRSRPSAASKEPSIAKQTSAAGSQAEARRACARCPAASKTQPACAETPPKGREPHCSALRGPRPQTHFPNRKQETAGGPRAFRFQRAWTLPFPRGLGLGRARGGVAHAALLSGLPSMWRLPWRGGSAPTSETQPKH